ncbi:carbohydrate ABC transporter permease [Aquibacillus salsiterrae]|uniref:Sugar ABC transporter permease n=1 Tax=Aquibacillus salsiterrae TaxID=2950439 RepID=A0A9X3WBK6_9BACI|nr:sugar ABC transporter permease [Aquibacillus salsiterrae]MDC3416630.1 sugar ABC transporter permease [Aquibacillus salsiterrae]
MILPSIILIIAVIIWPITVSFWNSMFDYQLNDPTRSEKMLSAHIDLERYADNYFLVNNSMKNLQSFDETGLQKETFSDLIAGLDSFHQQLLADTEIEQKYQMVEEMLINFEPVNDDELRYSSIDNDFALTYKNYIQETLNILSRVEASSTDMANAIKTVKEQLTTLESSILQSNFIGFEHYINYLFDGRMWSSLSLTSMFTVISVLLELVFGLIIALIINRVFHGRGLVRVSVLIPWAIPTAVAAMMWRFLYDGQSGIIAYYLERIGLIADTGYLLSTSAGGVISIILADVWKTTPYMALLLLAGLQTIPGQLYEAAQVDGANRFNQFFKITLPMLKSTILVAVLFRTLDAFRVFDLIYVLTGGGPANSTESISVYAYKTFFSQQNFGAGSALSIIVFLCIVLISVLFIRFIGSDLFEKKANR